VTGQATSVAPGRAARPGGVPRAEYDALIADYNDLRENRDDIAAELELEPLRTSPHVVEITVLQRELRACRRSRDELMAESFALAKAVKAWRRKALKAAA
jgi:hypothetical protein